MILVSSVSNQSSDIREINHSSDIFFSLITNKLSTLKYKLNKTNRLQMYDGKFKPATPVTSSLLIALHQRLMQNVAAVFWSQQWVCGGKWLQNEIIFSAVCSLFPDYLWKCSNTVIGTLIALMVTSPWKQMQSLALILSTSWFWEMGEMEKE